MEIVEFVKTHAALFGAVAGASASGIIAYALAWFRLRWRGSRRNSKNWGQNMQFWGDSDWLKLGGRKVVDDTVDTEGSGASFYFALYTAYFYIDEPGVRYCFLRSYVREIYSWFEWETERRLGSNLMNQAVPDDAVPCRGLEERIDAKGTKYWVTIPVEDVFVKKIILAELDNVAPPDQRPVQVQD